MSDEMTPQAKEMADESMIRTLKAQADAIWPQEQRLFDRYHLQGEVDILDAGCGTGEISLRLGQRFPGARLLGVDVIDAHLERARVKCAALGSRVRFEQRNILALDLPDNRFDLTVCRHVLQTIPRPDRAVAELVRTTRKGGWVHLIPEDYLMIHFEPRELDPDDFWCAVPRQYGAAIGTEFRIGRHAYRILRNLGLQDIAVDYVVVDPLRVPRTTFADMWRAWRDGFVDAIATHTAVTHHAARAHFEQMIATIEDPDGYGVWQVPVVSARVPI